MTVREATLSQAWKPGFRHSAGKAGSHFIRAIREGRLLGWKTARLGVTIPPIETGEPGEWVEVGPGATLVGFAPPDEQAANDIPSGTVFAAVNVDGADTMLYALVVSEDPDALGAGMRLMPVFPDAGDSAATLPAFHPVGVAE